MVPPRLKIHFSEYGHAAYQNKGNENYKKIHANILPLHTHLTPVVGPKSCFFLFVAMLHIKLKGMKRTTTF